MKPQLLCTFTDHESVFSCIKIITKTFQGEGVQIDTYTTPNGIVCIYNVVDRTKRIPNTISINKRKETNTYYSINALNALIIALNNGVLDKKYPINWSDYVNCMLLSAGQNGYKCLEIQKLNLS